MRRILKTVSNLVGWGSSENGPVTEPWVSYCPTGAQLSVVMTHGREYNSYILAKLVDDINKILLKGSKISITRLPKR
jgi:hypothetical protein